MNNAIHIAARMKREIWSWSPLKIGLLLFSILIFLTSSFLYLTPPGLQIREFLAGTVITTQHRDWAWIFVGAEKRDMMVKQNHQNIEESATEKLNLGLIKHHPDRSIDSLIKVEDISDKFWKGKLMYVYDPTSVRVVVPNKVGEGERISSMVQRTGAVAGINGGGFVDPDGLGNGFLPIGLIMSDYEPMWTDAGDDAQQYMIGFTDEGTLIVGKYSLNELRQIRAKEAVSFYAPRLIANGRPQITTGDGGWGRAPRTAIGQKEDGTLLFVVIDGRQTHSVGATLKEVQELLLNHGAVNAGLLDGGASSELVLKDGELVTKPSSRWGERRLPSGLLVFDHPDEVAVASPWQGLSKIDPGGAHDHPDYLRDLRSGKLQPPSTPKTPEKNTGPQGEEAPANPAGTGNNAGSAGSSGAAGTGSKTGNGTGSAGSTGGKTGGTGGSGASSAPLNGAGTGTGTTPGSGTGKSTAPGAGGTTGGSGANAGSEGAAKPVTGTTPGASSGSTGGGSGGGPAAPPTGTAPSTGTAATGTTVPGAAGTGGGGTIKPGSGAGSTAPGGTGGTGAGSSTGAGSGSTGGSTSTAGSSAGASGSSTGAATPSGTTGATITTPSR